MTLTAESLFFLLCTATIMVFHCAAGGGCGSTTIKHHDQYPPPTGLSYKWLDRFIVNVAWKKPSGLPDDSRIGFCLKGNTDGKLTYLKGNLRNYTISQSFLTEEMYSGRWTYNISTVIDHLHEGKAATIPISTLKPRAELVKDFRCVIYSDEMKCSWIPVNRSVNLTLSYRICGSLEESIKSLRTCDEPYSVGERIGCNLHLEYSTENVCILVETEAAMSTFKSLLVVPPPKLTVTEKGDRLTLSSTPPEIGKNNCWTYEVCYKLCNKPKVCQNTSEDEPTVMIPYDKNCLYEFQSKVRTGVSCARLPLSSDFGVTVTHGTNKLPELTLTVVCIVVPVILSICVILTCCCFRRYRTIICPVIPDPSAIFKEMMMMNGSKELKIAGSLYTPMTEHVEPCKVSLVSEGLHQNS